MKNASSKFVVDLRSAIKHYEMFIEKDEYLLMHLRNIIEISFSNSTYKMMRYRDKFKVNMEKEELLRDIVFLGASIVEQSVTSAYAHTTYKSLVRACVSIIEIGKNKEFDTQFITKMLKAKSSFECNDGIHFKTEAFYFVFKTHFRIN